MILLYQTRDRNFAARALRALRSAGIDCYFEPDLDVEEPAADADGSDSSAPVESDPGISDQDLAALRANADEYARQSAQIRDGSDPGAAPDISICAVNNADYAGAEEILLSMGAARELFVTDNAVSRINQLGLWLAAIAVVVIALLIWQAS